MRASTEEIMKDIQDRVSKTLEHLVPAKNTEEMRRVIKVRLMETVAKIIQDYGSVNMRDVELEVVPDKLDPTMVNISPKNFFTFLLFYGIYYPLSAMHPDIDEYIAPEGPYVGTKFCWDHKKKEGRVIPPDMIGPFPFQEN